MSLLALAAQYAEEPGTCLLYSGGSRDTAQYSYLGLFPQERIQLTGPTCWDDCKQLLGPLAGATAYPEWMGCLSYSAGAFADRRKQLVHRPKYIPDITLLRHSTLIQQCHRTGRLTALRGEIPAGVVRLAVKGASAGSLEHRSHTRDEYLRAVAEAKEAIFAGEVYQLNLSQEFTIRTNERPYDVFLRLVENNPASFSAYVKLPGGTIVSSSPERFLVNRGGQLETRPIKGTAPRGKTAVEDRANSDWLQSSEKNRAELLMITDLMRNDLGQVAVTGSVRVPELYRLEAYENVFHLLSRVEALLRPGVHALDAVRCAFPGGSITGCPKLRAMELIDSLEQRARHIYTGSIGYFAANGDFDWNIAIRTLLFRDGLASVQLGGGIVADSIAEEEYAETLHKGASIFRALGVQVDALCLA